MLSRFVLQCRPHPNSRSRMHLGSKPDALVCNLAQSLPTCATLKPGSDSAMQVLPTSAEASL